MIFNGTVESLNNIRTDLIITYIWIVKEVWTSEDCSYMYHVYILRVLFYQLIMYTQP